jgi:hypothetical protein
VRLADCSWANKQAVEKVSGISHSFKQVDNTPYEDFMKDFNRKKTFNEF